MAVDWRFGDKSGPQVSKANSRSIRSREGLCGSYAQPLFVLGQMRNKSIPFSLPSPLAAGLALLALGVILFFSYCNTFYIPPLLDDYHTFIYEPKLHATSGWSPADILILSHTKFGWKRWIPMLTFAFDLRVGGGELVSFHLSNLTIHFLTALAVFFLIRALVSWQGSREPVSAMQPNAWHIALWTAGLWALHPVQTNAVTYLVQRMASLVTLFSVLCVALYVIARSLMLKDGRFGLKAAMLLAGSLTSLGLAFLCKENSFIIPMLLLFTEAWYFRTDTFHRVFVVIRKHYLIATIMALILALLFYTQLSGFLDAYEKRHFTLIERVMTEWRVMVWYISLLLWPSPNRLSLEHDVVVSTSIFQPITTLFSLLFLVLIVAGIFSQRKRHPLITYGFLWFLLNLVTESTVIPLELVFEHRLYLPSIGFIFVCVLAIYRVLMRVTRALSNAESRKIAWSAFAILASLLSLLTYQRNWTWADPIAFNRDNVAKAPLNPRAHVNLAVALSKAGAYTEALKEAEITLRLGKGKFESYSEATNAIVLCHFALGDYQRAVDEGERLIAAFPPGAGAAAMPLACFATAMAHEKLGQTSEAYQTVLRGLLFDQHMTMRSPLVTNMASAILADLFEKARSSGTTLDQDDDSGSGSLPVKTLVARTLLGFDCYSQAKSLLQESVAENPQNQTTQQMLENMNRGEVRSQLEKERWSFWRKYVLHPYSRFNLCMTAAYLARTTELPLTLVQLAERLLDHALQLHPDSADANLLKGWYHFQRDENEQAIEFARKTLELEPESARAWLGLGFFLAKAGNNSDAIAAFHNVLAIYPQCPARPAIADMMKKLQQVPVADQGALRSGRPDPHFSWHTLHHTGHVAWCHLIQLHCPFA
jgi:protein O-mannosyl-transferase